MKFLTPFLLLFLLALTLPANTYAITAVEIIEKSNIVSYYSGDDSKSRMAMLVFHKTVKKPVKKIFTFLRKDIADGGQQKYFLHFSYPSEIKNASFLVHKNIADDDFRRLYLPASNTVLMINGEQKQCAFMGSDFSAEDIIGRHTGKDKHQLVKEEVVRIKTKNGQKSFQTFLVESNSISQMDKIKTTRSWIDKETYLPIKKEFFNQDNELFKKYQVLDVKNIDGFPTVTRHKMSSLLEGTHTVMVLDLKNTKYNMGLPETIFAESSLKSPPSIVF